MECASYIRYRKGMKMRMRINKPAVALTFLSVLLPILSILMFEHITISESLGNMDSGSFGKSYELISIDEGEKEFLPGELFKLTDDIGEKIAITSEGKVDEIKVRLIYFNKSYVNLPMQEGRFFKKKDLRENYDCAVIGKKLIDKTYKKNSKRYITLEGMEFEVIGIIGYECETVMDQYIYINGLISKKIFDSSLYQVDFLEGGREDEILQYLYEELQKSNVIMESLTRGEDYFNSIVPRLLYSRWFLVMFVCILLCLILLSLEWINHQKKEIGIRRLLGATNGKLIVLLGKRYLKIILISGVAGGLYSMIFWPNYKSFLLIGYSITIPVITIFLGCMAIKIIKAPLEEVIK